MIKNLSSSCFPDSIWDSNKKTIAIAQNLYIGINSSTQLTVAGSKGIVSKRSLIFTLFPSETVELPINTREFLLQRTYI